MNIYELALEALKTFNGMDTVIWQGKKNRVWLSVSTDGEVKVYSTTTNKTWIIAQLSYTRDFKAMYYAPMSEYQLRKGYDYFKA